MDFEQGLQILKDKLGSHKLMALASCHDNYPMVRIVSCIFYNDHIYFKTDKNFRKTRQLYENPRVAMCVHGVQVEGNAEIKGLVVDEPGRVFEAKYKEYFWQSYNKYSHEEDEILVEVTPDFVEIWDEDEQGNAFQIFLDYKEQSAEYRPYD